MSHGCWIIGVGAGTSQENRICRATSNQDVAPKSAAAWVGRSDAVESCVAAAYRHPGRRGCCADRRQRELTLYPEQTLVFLSDSPPPDN